jgi:hypothetical protein
VAHVGLTMHAGRRALSARCATGRWQQHAGRANFCVVRLLRRLRGPFKVWREPRVGGTMSAGDYANERWRDASAAVFLGLS